MKTFATFNSCLRSKRMFASRTFPISPQGSICLDLSKVKNCSLKIYPSKSSHLSIDCPDYTMESTKINEKAVIDSLPSLIECDFAVCKREPFENIVIEIPELCNLSVDSQHLDLLIDTKFHGNFSVTSTSGLIDINKIRGAKIVVNAPFSNFKVKKIEGNASIAAGNFTAKMLYGDNMNVSSDGDLSIGAMYTKTSYLHSVRNLTVGHMQGYAQASAKEGDINIQMIDGSVEAKAQEGNILLHFNKLMNFPSDSSSSAHACLGKVNVMVDPEINCTLSCESQGSTDDSFVEVLSDSFVPAKQSQRKLDIECTLDDSSEPTQPVKPRYLSGMLTGVSMESKRPKFRNPNSSGKINTFSAEVLSLNALTTDSRTNNSNDNNNNESDSETEKSHIDLILTAFESVRVETLSWVEIIRRRHFPADMSNKDSAMFENSGGMDRKGKSGDHDEDDEVVENNKQKRNSSATTASQPTNTNNLKAGRTAQAHNRLQELLKLSQNQNAADRENKKG